MDFGADLIDPWRHTRELHDLALEALAAESNPPAEAGELAKAIGEKLGELESEFAMQRPPDPLH